MTSRMLTEIRQQPEALARTIDALRPQAEGLRAFAGGCDRVVFFARGTSDHAAIYGRYLCEIAGNIPAVLGAPSVATLYGAGLGLADSLVVVLSQSGATGELVEVAGWARRRGARTVAVTNVGDSALVEACGTALVLAAGPERAIPATKTYTTELAALVVLVAALTVDGEALLADLATVPAAVQHALDATGDDEVESTARALAGARALVVTGRAYTLSTAAEIAWKIQETAGLPAAGLSHADLEHGPAAVLGADVPTVVVAAPEGPTLPGLRATAAAARERGSRVVGIGGDAEFRRSCDHALPGTELPEALSPLALAVPGQLLAEALSRARGLDPDHPAGLTKVTQTTQ